MLRELDELCVSGITDFQAVPSGRFANRFVGYLWGAHIGDHHDIESPPGVTPRRAPIVARPISSESHRTETSRSGRTRTWAVSLGGRHAGVSRR